MSYCRFSSDNFMCAVYVYEDCNGGWTTHVAYRKSLFPPIPEIPLYKMYKFGEWDKETRRMKYPSHLAALLAWVVTEIWIFSHRLHLFSLRLIPMRKIGLPYDGEIFNDSTPDECADRLVMLRSLGYRVPQYAIDSLREKAQT